MAGSYNHIVLVGRLVADPELRQTQDGTPVTSFRIAVDRVRGRSGGEKQTDFFGVSVWRQRAERAAEFLQKGRLVLISGRCQIREYTDKENNRRTAVEVVADDFQMLDSRPGAGGGQERAATAPAAGDLPEYKYDAESEEEVPF
ncbi:MAG: single-stranded DNA-binding protein [Candidatus Eremiobacteraeota bacterium]|nr:single-stranded DNA-binding protein [Candidatus Eremiobacteraeota bacterium]MBV8222961.1 single-stranded DNA-binding protein [Candidatus Eremiobacteraeota bacterium]MBV8280898.1 single-stranded DNA-binding protein [Candidatus Eremiobacteraeota bacterium]